MESALKKRIRTVSNLIDLIQFHLIFQKLAKFSGVESKRTVSKFRKKENKHFCAVFTFSMKRAHEIRKFHVAVMQQRLKSVMHVQSCFANTNLRFFCRSRCRHRRCCLRSDETKFRHFFYFNSSEMFLI